MNRFYCLLALMLLSSPAHAGKSFSFVVAGHRIHIEAPRHCHSASCVSVSIPGIYQSRRSRDRMMRSRQRPLRLPARRRRRASRAAPRSCRAAGRSPPAPVIAPPAPASRPPARRRSSRRAGRSAGRPACRAAAGRDPADAARDRQDHQGRGRGAGADRSATGRPKAKRDRSGSNNAATRCAAMSLNPRRSVRRNGADQHEAEGSAFRMVRQHLQPRQRQHLLCDHRR